MTRNKTAIRQQRSDVGKQAAAAKMGDMTNQESLWQAVLARDAASDGAFYYAVTSTGVYCRPSCPSRRPLRQNVQFFRNPQDAERAGFRACRRCGTDESPAAEAVRKLCRYIESHLDERLTLQALSAEAGLSPFHLQRRFKAIVGMSPREYADACRMNTFKDQLKAGHPVTRAIYDAGYGSSSRLYERSSQLGMTPSVYRDGGRGAAIRYDVAESPLGRMLVASTERGVCMIRFGASEAELEREMREEYPAAELARDRTAVAPAIEALIRHLNGQEPRLEFPLDIRATAFQQRVWEHLRGIPYGTTQSYAEVAAAIGRPSANRAVARACAHNPVAVAIPCHRVVRKGGELGGYRWGVERKQALLEGERAVTAR